MGASWNYWSEQETNILRLRWFEHDHIRRISRLTGRSRRAVRHRGRYLGLPSHLPHIPWKASEDDYLRQNYQIHLAREIAHTLKKSSNAIIGRAHRLGLYKRKRRSLPITLTQSNASDRCMSDAQHIARKN